MVDEFRERTKKKGKRPDLFVVRLKCSFTQSFSFASSALNGCLCAAEMVVRCQPEGLFHFLRKNSGCLSENYSLCKNRLLKLVAFFPVLFHMVRLDFSLQQLSLLKMFVEK